MKTSPAISPPKYPPFVTPIAKLFYLETASLDWAQRVDVLARLASVLDRRSRNPRASETCSQFNPSDDMKSQFDKRAHEYFKLALHRCNGFIRLLSEEGGENPELIGTGSKDGSPARILGCISVDPLDASKNLGLVGPIGYIVGFWDAQFKEIFASIICVIGRGIEFYLAIRGRGTWRFTMENYGDPRRMVNLGKVQIENIARMKTLGNHTLDDPLAAEIASLRMPWRNSGCAAADIALILSNKIGGVFLYNEPAKLRFSYEAAPLGLCITEAGGRAVIPHHGVWVTADDVTAVGSWHKRVGFLAGSYDTVTKLIELFTSQIAFKPVV